jgi:hypothetical protein
MKRITLLILSTLFAITSLYAGSPQYVQEDYIMKKGDTLSEVLYKKGVHKASLLYGFNGNESCVAKNEELNPQIQNWNTVPTGAVIKIEYPFSTRKAACADVEKNYIVKKGDTLSGILYAKGVKGIRRLYAKDGYVEKNKQLNPNISDWTKLQRGTVIKIMYRKCSRHKKHVVKTQEVYSNVQAPVEGTEAWLSTQPNAEQVNPLGGSPAEAKVEEKALDYFLENRILLGFALGYDKYVQTSSITDISAGINFPMLFLQYQLYYRPTSNVDISSWEYRFMVELNKGLETSGINIPVSSQIEFGFGRYSLFKIGTTRFNPNIDLCFDINNTVAADINNNFSVSGRQTLWFGFKPELVSYIGSNMIEYYPFIYKSLYTGSLNEKFNSWKFGLKANVGLAFKNSLYGSFEYDYERHENTASTEVLYINNILFGLGYRF